MTYHCNDIRIVKTGTNAIQRKKKIKMEAN